MGSKTVLNENDFSEKSTDVIVYSDSVEISEWPPEEVALSTLTVKVPLNKAVKSEWLK